MKKELDFFYIGDSYGGNQDWCLDHMMQLGGCGAVTACDCSIYFKLRMGIAKAYPGSLASPASFFSEINMPPSRSVLHEDSMISESVPPEPFYVVDGESALPEMNLPKPLSVIDGEITMPVDVQDAPFFQGSGAALGIDRDTYIHFTEIMKPYLHPRWSGIDKLYLFTEGLARYYEEQGITEIEMEEFDGGNDVQEAMRRIREQLDQGYPIPCLILNHRNAAMEDYVWHWFLLVGYEVDDQDSSGEDFMVKTATYSEANWVRLRDLWNTGFPVKGGLILFHRNY